MVRTLLSLALVAAAAAQAGPARTLKAARAKLLKAGKGVPKGLPKALDLLRKKEEKGKRAAWAEKKRPARKTLVPHAHPLLKEAYEARGTLTPKDFAAAAAAPVAGLSEAREKAVAAHKAARLGSTNDDLTETDCSEFVHTSGMSYPESYEPVHRLGQ